MILIKPILQTFSDHLYGIWEYKTYVFREKDKQTTKKRPVAKVLGFYVTVYRLKHSQMRIKTRHLWTVGVEELECPAQTSTSLDWVSTNRNRNRNLPNAPMSSPDPTNALKAELTQIHMATPPKIYRKPEQMNGAEYNGKNKGPNHINAY